MLDAKVREYYFSQKDEDVDGEAENVDADVADDAE